MALAVPVCFVGDVLLSEEELGREVHHGGRNSVMNGQHLGGGEGNTYVRRYTTHWTDVLYKNCTLTFIVERLSARLLIVQCSQFVFVCMYVCISVTL